jgi:putative NADH-flavin reductase
MARLLILGASGGVGRLAVQAALDAGHMVTAQTRDVARLAGLPEAVRIAGADPLVPAAIQGCMRGQEAVLYALGQRTMRPTTFFSRTTRMMVEAMLGCGVRRLVAITGVGAGETRGHGGWFYDHVVFPLFTRKRYADKERQEALIRESGLDWTILRPAAFSKTRDASELEVHARVARDLRLRSITRGEVARCAVDLVENDGAVGQALFVGRP